MITALLLAAALQWEAPDGLISFADKGNVFRLDSRIERKQALEWEQTLKKNPKAVPPEPQYAKAPYYSAIGGNEGAMLDSKLIDVKPGQGYKLIVEAKGNSAPFVFIKGFRMHPRRKMLIDCYQTRMHASPLSENEWREFEIGFTPRGAEKMKVRLYVYWPVGVCYFRNIRIVEIDQMEMKRLIRKREQ